MARGDGADQGSPQSSPPILVREWHVATARTSSPSEGSSSAWKSSVSAPKTGVALLALGGFTATMPKKSRPSSVSVPVLSKHTVLMAPQVLMVDGSMQKICFRRRRICAFKMPMLMAAGRAGGTTMVMMSSERTTIFLMAEPRMIMMVMV
uniref:Uncharacterized protein n=1 Tax=Steinernema glaseri TaxID=37863 RepID=A0A1I8AA86_9BILA